MPDIAYRVVSILLKAGIYVMLVVVALKLDRIITLLERALWLQTNLM